MPCVSKEKLETKKKKAKEQASDRGDIGGDIVLREDFVRNVFVMTSVQGSDESEATNLSSNASKYWWLRPRGRTTKGDIFEGGYMK